MMKKTEIEINNLTSKQVDKNFLRKVAEKTLSLIKFCVPEISIVLVGGAKMKNLNKKYRQSNRVTDVLTFDYGEIIICLSQAQRQARELIHPLKKELGILLIHGILHLAGYNDITKKDRLKIIKKQEELWQKITL